MNLPREDLSQGKATPWSLRESNSPESKGKQPPGGNQMSQGKGTLQMKVNV